jgi:hypothetical protein
MTSKPFHRLIALSIRHKDPVRVIGDLAVSGGIPSTFDSHLLFASMPRK